tara:strand:- start:264 stop:1298 length:1035 start_codon:yes stop_codon:yes gene_type:complete
MGKRGVLVMNIGTPDEPTTESVRTYLREFLLDPDVIDLPTPLRHLLVRGIILRTRPQKIAPRYESIWMEEGSPLRVYTQRMTKALEASIDDIQCEVGMRYGNPSIRSGLEKLKEAGVDELLLAPMFPHHAQATTGSSLKHAYKQLKAMDWKPAIIELPHFPSEPAFIEPLANSIRPHLSNGTHLLFSYHGLPISHLKRSDSSGKHCQKIDNCCSIGVEGNTMCYAHHCMLTTLSVVGALGIDELNWSISYQSRLGPAKWLQPSTTKMVENLAEDGKTKIAIVSPAFLADGLETLEELDIEIREHFIEHGGQELVVVNCLNDDPNWIQGLVQLVENAFSKPMSTC